MSNEWKVLPHGALEVVKPGLWCVAGTLSNMALDRNMIVWKAPDGGLVLHSVICLDEAGMAALEALGKPKVLIVPSAGHRLDIAPYKARYPDATVVAPANARAKVEEVVKVDETAEVALPPLGVRVHRPTGMQDGYELVYEIDLPEGGQALIINDVLSSPKHAKGLGGLVLKVLGPSGGQLGIPRIVRFMFGKDMKAYAGFVGGLAKLPDVRAVTFSHGQFLTADCASALATAATRI